MLKSNKPPNLSKLTISYEYYVMWKKLAHPIHDCIMLALTIQSPAVLISSHRLTKTDLHALKVLEKSEAGSERVESNSGRTKQVGGKMRPHCLWGRILARKIKMKEAEPRIWQSDKQTGKSGRFLLPLRSRSHCPSHILSSLTRNLPAWVFIS